MRSVPSADSDSLRHSLWDAGATGRLQTPTGVRDVLPAEARARRQLEAVIRETFAEAGYEEVETPICEYEEVFAAAGLVEDSWQVYRFFDREGRTLVLRPDMTAPIARLAATRLAGAARPLRLSYIGDVFRYEEVHAGRQRQFRQAGVERIGGERSVEADLEVLALAGRLLWRCGLERFRIDVGHAQLVQELVAAGQWPEREGKAVRRALRERNYVLLAELAGERSALPVEPQSPATSPPAGRLPPAGTTASLGTSAATAATASLARELVLELPRWRGGFEVLAAARARLEPLFVQRPGLAAALDELEQILAGAKAAGMQLYDRHGDPGGDRGGSSPGSHAMPSTPLVGVDLGLVRDLSYYTGPVLEGFVPDLGLVLLTGGRYDRLVEQLGGRPEPATGFAVGLERLMLARERASASR
ncbi:MAG TPA: ATP phosphoribosyltransferase regulatory subunit [Firmicutes bacterium]|nr:ATP phosphoribosyltransferase regulatory subunit [Bacillota bacterium]